MSTYKTKGGEARYFAKIYNKNTKKSKSRSFLFLKDAVKWRKENEIEIYGAEILYKDEKKMKHI